LKKRRKKKNEEKKRWKEQTKGRERREDGGDNIQRIAPVMSLRESTIKSQHANQLVIRIRV
jgi:hypothetical protein